MKTNQLNQDHIVSYDYLRLLASLMVVSIHIADTVTGSATNYLGGLSWWLANFIQAFSRGAVPIFVLQSGALMLNKPKVTSSYLSSKAIRRLLVLGIFWITLFFVLQSTWHGVIYSPWSLIQDIWNSKISHLYYIYLIIGLYLMTPYIQKWNQKISLKTTFVFLTISILWEYLFNQFEIYNPLNTAMILWIPYLPYYLLGSKLKDLKINKYYLLAGIAGTTLINAISNYYGTLSLGLGTIAWWMNHNGDYFWSNLSPTVAILSIAIFSLFSLKFFNFPAKINHAAKYLATYTYGVYLVHPFLIDLFDRLTGMPIHKVAHDIWIYFSLKIIGIYLLSLLAIHILKYFKFGRIILGES